MLQMKRMILSKLFKRISGCKIIMIYNNMKHNNAHMYLSFNNIFYN